MPLILGRLIPRFLFGLAILGGIQWVFSPIGALAQIREFQVNGCIVEVPAAPVNWIRVKAASDEIYKLDLTRWVNTGYKLEPDLCELFSIQEDPKTPGIYFVQSVEEGQPQFDPGLLDTEEPTK